MVPRAAETARVRRALSCYNQGVSPAVRPGVRPRFPGLFQPSPAGQSSVAGSLLFDRVEKESGTELPHSKGALGVRQLVAAFIFNQVQRVCTSLLASFVSSRMEKESGTELPHSKGALGVRQLVAAFIFDPGPAFGRPCSRHSCQAGWKKKAVPSYRTPRGLWECGNLSPLSFSTRSSVCTSLLASFVSSRMEKESGTELPHSKGAGRRCSLTASPGVDFDGFVDYNDRTVRTSHGRFGNGWL